MFKLDSKLLQIFYYVYKLKMSLLRQMCWDEPAGSQ